MEETKRKRKRKTKNKKNESNIKEKKHKKERNKKRKRKKRKLGRPIRARGARVGPFKRAGVRGASTPRRNGRQIGLRFYIHTYSLRIKI